MSLVKREIAAKIALLQIELSQTRLKLRLYKDLIADSPEYNYASELNIDCIEIEHQLDVLQQQFARLQSYE